MQPIQDPVATTTDRMVALAPQLLAAAAALAVCVVIGHLLGEGLSRMLTRGERRNRYSRLVNRGVRAGFALIGVILGLQILGLTAVATSLLATGGLMAVVLGFAFREIGENLLAGIFLGVSRSFEVGDLIESSGSIGHVREIELRQVWIRSADGRDIFIPSAQILRNVLVNYTRDDLRRAEFTVGIDYGDPIPAARDLLLRVISRVPGVLDDPAPSVRVSELAPQYCELEATLWVNTEQDPRLLAVRTQAMEGAVAALREAGYTLSSDVVTAVRVQSSDPTHR
jgi:small-conductance mechanosensitive channel